MNMYVGNLSPDTTEDELRRAFQAHGKVSSVSLLRTEMRGGRRTGPSRGRAFVAMPDHAQALAAVVALDRLELHGQAMAVQGARSRISRRRRR